MKMIDLETAKGRLVDTGLLYALNKTVLHPLGLALGFYYDDADGPPVGLTFVLNAEDGIVDPIVFDDRMEEEGKRRLREFLARLDPLPSNVELLRKAAE